MNKVLTNDVNMVQELWHFWQNLQIQWNSVKHVEIWCIKLYLQPTIKPRSFFCIVGCQMAVFLGMIFLQLSWMHPEYP